ncbi:uncharacterized protein BO96DRAFT_172179 [Aspergillus niger CBS 101883]|uniref:uncharacterized protein n=1 Tax=Aspergillus lacticoffeatus (strain CBS 101883) TaxID=1450533 RepID=UPI000D7F1816|nr:uncharacterized protein BO96DRAFT_172179 [Aspergillus niger CBS 101883]PYH51896.1 hypothetical protein BO96DRAFT_172179 [Aspergillus niger CBS 101883]
MSKRKQKGLFVKRRMTRFCPDTHVLKGTPGNCLLEYLLTVNLRQPVPRNIVGTQSIRETLIQASMSLEMLALKANTMHHCHWRRGIQSMRLGQVTRTTTWKCTAATRWRQPFKLQVVPQWNKGTGRCQSIRTARLWTLDSIIVDGVGHWTSHLKL